jgi:hypothetical protein
MRIFVLTATYELRVSRKSHLRDHPTFHVNFEPKKTMARISQARSTVNTHNS